MTERELGLLYYALDENDNSPEAAEIERQYFESVPYRYEYIIKHLQRPRKQIQAAADILEEILTKREEALFDRGLEADPGNPLVILNLLQERLKKEG